MSAQYDLYETPDPANTGEQKPLHARIVPSGTYSKKEFLERVSRSSQTFNYNVIDAVVGVVIDELAEALSEGYTIELGELGYFSISLKCTHKVMTKREIRAESICFDNVHLRTSIFVNVELEEPCFMFGNKSNNNQFKDFFLLLLTILYLCLSIEKTVGLWQV